MVVTVGDTEREPSTATLPTPLLIVTVVALVVAQVRVEDCPALIVAGAAVKLSHFGASGAGVTVTVTGQFFVAPAALVTVKV